MRHLLLPLLFATTAAAFENHESKEDAVLLQSDGYYGSPEENARVSGDMPFYRAYGYSFFPVMNIAGMDLVGNAEFSFLPRQFRMEGAALNGQSLQSYGLGLGLETMHTARQQGLAYALWGINGDMRDVGPETFYGDLSYMHQFFLSERLMLGGGFDLHFYFGSYFPYPVVLLDWRLAEHTKLKIDIDTGELKQFLTDNLSVSLGAQYDIFHYGFGRGKGYAMETASEMVRVERRLGQNTYLRISVKHPFWGGEKVWTDQGRTESSAVDEGISVRLQAAYWD